MSPMKSAQNNEKQLIAFLQNPESYNFNTGPIKIIHTHASIVALVPPFVYKVKKQVDLGFMDFRQLADRKANCKRELDLNSRLSDGIYLEIVPIFHHSGTFDFHSSQHASIVDYALKMKMMEDGYFLPQLLTDGKVDEKMIFLILKKLQTFYQQQTQTPEIAAYAKTENLRQNADDNFESLRTNIEYAEMEGLSEHHIDLIAIFSYHQYLNEPQVFEQRIAQQKIKDCHGDLHLDHIHIQNGQINIFDCLEFSDRYRYSDVAADLAFLAMDFDFHGHPQFSRYIIKEMAALMEDDDLLSVIHYYKSYRAMVRAKVDLLQLKQTTTGDKRPQLAKNVKRYLQLALRYLLIKDEAVAFIVGGRIGTGKTTIANALATALCIKHINSDVIRKESHAEDLYERSGEAAQTTLYSEENTEATYNKMLRDGLASLHNGHSVVLDATFGNRKQRKKFLNALDGQVYYFVETCAADGLIQQRLAARESKKIVSDARLEDFEKLAAAYQTPEEVKGLIQLDTEKHVADNLKTVLTKLAL